MYVGVGVCMCRKARGFAEGLWRCLFFFSRWKQGNHHGQKARRGDVDRDNAIAGAGQTEARAEKLATADSQVKQAWPEAAKSMVKMWLVVLVFKFGVVLGLRWFW